MHVWAIYKTGFVKLIHILYNANVGEIVLNSSHELRHRYIANRFDVEEDDWPPHQPKHYTTLALIHHQGKYTDRKVFSVTKQLAAQGNIASQISQVHSDQTTEVFSNTTKKIADLFEPRENVDGFIVNPNTILIEGAPGIGKTILSKEIAYQWAKNNVLQSKKLLFLIILRNFNEKIISMEMFLQKVLNSTQMAKNVTKYITENGGEDLAIVLDGYDELSESNRKNSFIAAIIHRNVFPRCLLVITSRPTASLILHDNVDCRVEVVGFSEADRLDYIKSSLPESYEQVNNYLQLNPTINALCYIPLNMTILLCLVENGIDNLPKTQTKLYEIFIEMTIKRFLQKMDHTFSTLPINNIFDLPHPHNRVFRELAKFAFEALKCDKLAFTIDELNKICPHLVVTPTNWNGLGLLNSVKSFLGKDYVTYNFLHFSVQEYMAAYHITTLSTNEQVKLLKNTFWTVRYYNTWIMYAGITGGKSFELQHFLSGNWLQFSTKLLGFKSISQKLLNDKVKCLHMFQCLAETQNNEYISLLKNIFQDKVIDLSKQTLLPRDLNTLGFFLIRSSTKQWKRLNFSKCNIGSDRCKILSDTLLNRNDYNTVTVNCIDFSYNQLNFSSFIALFDLLKSLQTADFIASDNSILENSACSYLFATLEEAFVCAGNETMLQTVFIGTFAFAYKVDEEHILSINPATRYKSIYLLNCRLSFEANLIKLLYKHDLLNIHLLGMPLNAPFIKVLKDMLLNHSQFASLFIYDATLLDEVAEEIGDLIVSNNSAGIMVVISETKLQGTISTSSLNAELSKLEILNLIVKLRSLCFTDKAPAVSWSNQLRFLGDGTKAMTYSFVNALGIITSCQIRVRLLEGDLLFAHKINLKDLEEDVPFELTTTVYLVWCNLSAYDYKLIIENCGNWSIAFLYIVHSYVPLDILCSVLSYKYYTIQGLFFHTNCTISSGIFNASIATVPFASTVFVTNNMVVIHNPTIKQLALAFHLETSITVWKFLACQFSADSLYFILSILTSTDKMWAELDFIDCDIRCLHFEVFWEFLRNRKFIPNARKINLSKSVIPLQVSSAFVDLLILLNVKELNVTGITFYNSLLQKLKDVIFSFKAKSQLSLTLFLRDIKAYFFYNVQWKTISKSMETESDEVFIFSCEVLNLNKDEVTNIIYVLSSLSQLCTVRCSLVVSKIFEELVNTELEMLTKHSAACKGDYLYRVIVDKSLLHKANVHFAFITRDYLFSTCCNFMDADYEAMIKNCDKSSISVVYILHSCLCLETLCSILFSTKWVLQELFLHTSHNISMEILNSLILLCPNTSVVLITNNTLVLHNPTTKNLALAIQLQPSINMWKFLACELSAECFYLILCILATTDKIWAELDFIDCDIRHLHFEVICEHLLKSISSIEKVTFSKSKLPSSVSSVFAEMLILMNVAEIVIATNTIYMYDNLSENIWQNWFKLTGNNQISLCIVFGDIKACFFSHVQWNTICKMMDKAVNKLFLFNCQQPNFCKNEVATTHVHMLSNLSQLCAVHCSLQDTMVCRILEEFARRELKLSIIDAAAFQHDNMYRLIIDKSLLFEAKVHFLVMTSSILYDCLSCCNISDLEYKVMINNCDKSSISIVYILHSCLSLESTLRPMLSSTRWVLQELFLHTCNEIPMEILNSLILLCPNTSVVLITNNTLVLHNPTTKNLALAIQLQPSINVWKFLACELSAECFYLILCILATTDKKWAELDFIDCNITQLHFEVAYEYLKSLKAISIIQRLTFSKGKVPSSVPATFLEILILMNVTELIIFEETFYKSLLEKLREKMYGFSDKLQMFLTIICQNLKAHVVHNVHWNTIAKLVDKEVDKLFMYNCQLPKFKVPTIFDGLSKVSQLCIVRCSLQDIVVSRILKDYANREMEISITDTVALKNDNLYQLFTEKCLLLDAKVHLLMMANNILYIINPSRHQFCLLKSISNHLSEIENRVIMLARKFRLRLHKCLLAFHDHQLEVMYFSGKKDEIVDIITKVSAVNTTVKTLRILGMNNCTISKSGVYHVENILKNNFGIEGVYLNNSLHSKGVFKLVLKALQSTSSLKHLEIGHNSITDELLDTLLPILYKNTKLNTLGMGYTNLEDKGMVKVSQALLNGFGLQKLGLECNNITKKASGYIANIILHHNSLQVLNLNGNNLQVEGIRNISNALKTTTGLRMLALDNNNATEEAADSIADVLLKNININTLYINGNDLRVAGIIKIVKGLHNTYNLQQLLLSNNNITEEAAGHVALLISQNTNLTVLNLSNNNLQSAGAIRIARALQNIFCLTEVYIKNNNITEEAADDLATVLSRNGNLTVLNLNGNNLKAAGVVTIAKGLQTSTLQRLKLERNNATKKAAHEIAAVLSHNINLQVLNLGGNKLEVTGIIKIANSLKTTSTLTKLYFNDNNITEAAADEIAAVLSHNTNLQVLNLNGNELAVTGIIKIANSLKTTSTLTKLYLSYNNITEAAADEIAAVLSHNINLQVLNLNGNKLEVTGITKIANSLQNTTTLTELYLSDNNITEEVADHIAAALSHNNYLSVLDLNRNNLKATGVVTITNALQTSALRRLELERNNATKEAADGIAAVLSLNTNLQVLNLNGNKLEVTGIIKIANSLQSTSTLTELYLSDNNITGEAADDIANILSLNSSIKVLNLNRNNLKVQGVITISKALRKHNLQQFEIERNNATKKAAHEIAAVLSHSVDLQVLNLNGNMLEVVGIVTIAHSLLKVSTLTELYLSDNNITEKAADYIAAVLSHSKNLQVLNLNRNNLRATGVIKIVKALQMSTLQKLEIENNNATLKAAQDIAAILSHSSNLRVLNINGNNLQANGVACILHATSSLTHLYVSNNNISGEFIDEVTDSLSCHTNLQVLHLNGNILGTKGMTAIANSLQNISALRKLQLSNNSLTDEAADSIAQLLPCNNCLQELVLGDNLFQSKGIIKIAKSLFTVFGLTCFRINNSHFSEEAADKIAEVLSYTTNLQILDLNGNNLQTSGVIKIVNGIRNTSCIQELQLANNNAAIDAALYIAAVISHNANVQIVNLSGNNLQTEGTRTVAKALKTISSLTRLYISNNNITKEAAYDIESALSTNTNLQVLDLTKNNLQATGFKRLSRALQNISSINELLVSDNNITEEAADDIAAVVLHNTNLQVLNLSRNKLKVAGIIKVLKALQNASLITELHFSNNNITEEAADDIATVLSQNTNLQILDLSVNNLKATGIAKIMKQLKNISSITELYISNNDITEEAADDIANTLLCTTNLRILDIGYNNLNSAGITRIAKCLQCNSLMTELYLSSNDITEEAAEEIGNAVVCNSMLKVLCLNGNKLNAGGAIAIAKAVQSSFNLHHLEMRNTNIISEAACIVRIALLGKYNLQVLDLSENNLGVCGVTEIAAGVKGTFTLQKLVLENNNASGTAACTIAGAIAGALRQNTHLTVLNLNSNNLQSGIALIAASLQNTFTLQQLEFAKNNLSNEEAVYIAAILEKSENLQVLNLHGNRLFSLGVTTVTKSLKGISKLKHLDLSSNMITGEAANNIAAVLSHNVGLQVLNLDKNNLHAAGIIAIVKGLKTTYSLQKLGLRKNNISNCKEAVHALATVLSNNPGLHMFNLEENDLQKEAIFTAVTTMVNLHAIEVIHCARKHQRTL